jgi:hypothetical protein
VLVGGIASDKHSIHAVLARDHDTQVPEADVIELRCKLETRSLLNESMKIEVVRPCTGRDGRMEEEALADIDAAEEAPEALQLRL